MFQFDHQMRRRTAHVFDCILIAEIITALDSIEHVPVPVIRPYIRQGGIDATLRRHRVGACRKNLRHYRDTRLGLCQLQGRAQTAAAGANYQGIEFTMCNIHTSTTANSISDTQIPIAVKNRVTSTHKVKRITVS